MSSTIIITDKATGRKYAYESVSYRDPVTKKPRSTRTYLGRVDPVSGEIIPKAKNGKRNRTPLTNPSDNLPAGIREQIQKKDEQIQALEKSLDWYRKKSKADDKLIHQLSESVQSHQKRWSSDPE